MDKRNSYLTNLPKVDEKPKEEVKQELKVDIALEKKKKALELKKEDDKVKAEQALAQKKKLLAVQEEARQDDLRDKESKAKARKDALQVLQQSISADEKNSRFLRILKLKLLHGIWVIWQRLMKPLTICLTNFILMENGNCPL